jgi:hypothetical protein
MIASILVVAVGIGLAIIASYVIDVHKKVQFLIQALAELQANIQLLAGELDKTNANLSRDQLECSSIQTDLAAIRYLLIEKHLASESEIAELTKMLRSNPEIKPYTK